MIEIPRETPQALREACKCEPIDAAWPIQSPLHALELLAEWAEIHNDRDVLRNQKVEQNWAPLTVTDHVYRLTHSHHHEYADLNRYGYIDLYRRSVFTKYVSIGWHLAGRYTYDNALIEWLAMQGWPRLRLVDFGAAPWIQAIFYARKGLEVTVINESTDSDCHRFGRFLAEKSGVTGIKEFSSLDPAWRKEAFDIVYTVDVLEHIPPEEDGTPGWVRYAEDLYQTLAPKGVMYINAPLEKREGRPVPVATHAVHFTSPYTTQEWCRTKGLVENGGGLWMK